MGSFNDEQGRVINFTDGLVYQTQEPDSVNHNCIGIDKSLRPLVIQEATPGDFSPGAGDFTIYVRHLRPIWFSSARRSREKHLLDSYDAVNQVGWYIEFRGNTIDFCVSDGTNTRYIVRSVAGKDLNSALFDRYAVVRRNGVIRVIANDEVVGEAYYNEPIGSRNELAVCSGWNRMNNTAVGSINDVSGYGIVESIYVVKEAILWDPSKKFDAKFDTQLSGTTPVLEPVYFPPKGNVIPYDSGNDPHSANVVMAITGGDANAESVDAAIGGVGRYLGGMSLVVSEGSNHPKVLKAFNPHSSLTIPMDGADNFGEEVFTISFRIKIEPNSNRQAILFGTWYDRDLPTDDPYTGGWHLMYAFNSFYFRHSASLRWQNISIEDNEWHDVIITRDANMDLRLYVDRFLNADVFNEPANLNRTNGYFTVGFASGMFLSLTNNIRPGYLFEDIVLTKGVVRDVEVVNPTITVTEPALANDLYSDDTIFMFNGAAQLVSAGADLVAIDPVVGDISNPTSTDNVKMVNYSSDYPFKETPESPYAGPYPNEVAEDRFNNDIVEFFPYAGGLPITLDNSDQRYTFGTGDFTIEMRKSPFNNSTTLFGLGNGVSQGTIRLDINTLGDLRFYHNNELIILGINREPNYSEEIYTLAVCRHKDILSLYINGNIVGSAFFNEDITDTGDFYFGGRCGLVEEFRITGAARYKESYTPSVERMGDTPEVPNDPPEVGDTTAYDTSSDPDWTNVVFYAKGANSASPFFEVIQGNDIQFSRDAEMVASAGSINPFVYHAKRTVLLGDVISKPVAGSPWNVDYALGTGDLTISLRFKTGSNFVGGAILDAMNYGGGSWQIFVDDSGVASIYTSDSGKILELPAFPVNDENWHEIKYVRSAGSGTLIVDGNSSSSIIDSRDYSAAAKGIVIGYEEAISNFYALDFFAEEIKISKDARL